MPLIPYLFLSFKDLGSRELMENLCRFSAGWFNYGSFSNPQKTLDILP
jgi:hypothetical protein